MPLQSISLFNRLKLIYKDSPAMAFALLWVMIIPIIGSSLLLSFLYESDTSPLMVPHFFGGLGLILIGSVMMGFALCPTTLLAIITGLFWSWTAFPFLVIAYSLASLLGYFVGLKVDHNSLGILLENYPKAAQVVRGKRNKMGTLIFFVRISPVIPFALSNLLFALLRTGWKNVLVYGLFGMLPRTLMAFGIGVMAESILEALSNKKGSFEGFLFLVLLFLSIWGIIRFFRSDRSKT
ncbi:VTT domain-containing protein [Echinicola sp. CAU 1574]|uniref:VTT domain-containing protein n=1 Tax=Echinicola arenosa TaxID=2774144 RepID=A0ABR9AHR6_9BACT|nr:VTT domain-containing protein [Echinicola arenosa]MBD8487877.1 VTT domain-containing protein [Echinicola arenosa]